MSIQGKVSRLLREFHDMWVSDKIIFDGVSESIHITLSIIKNAFFY